MRIFRPRETRNDVPTMAYEIFWPGLETSGGHGHAAFATHALERARQVTSLMAHIQRDFYEAPTERGGLGLRYIDTDPRPDLSNPEHMRQRLGWMSNPDRRYIGAYMVRDGRPSAQVDEMVGMLVLEQLHELSFDGRPQVEIVELDTRQAYRRAGIGDTLLAVGRGLVAAHTKIVLDVAESNHGAISYYGGRGFVFSYNTAGQIESSRHGVYDINHLAMHADEQSIATSLERLRGRNASLLTLPETPAAQFAA